MASEEALEDLTDEKLDEFEGAQVTYGATETVKEGVECDTYLFNEDDTRDLAIVRVAGGFKTPLQKVLQGSQTVEGYISGSGTLTVTATNGEIRVYAFKDGGEARQVQVGIGEIMQWVADADSNLVFYEVCFPPYQDGRFEVLPG